MVNATISWVGASGAVSYKVEYKLSSAANWTLFGAAITGTTATITNLNEGTSYDFRITSNCTTGTSSPTTTTGVTPCKNVSGLTADFVGATAQLTWDKKDHALSYQIHYKLQSSQNWIQANGSPLSNNGLPALVNFSINGLTSGSAYDFRVIVDCEVGNSTGSIISATSTCIAPTGLNVTFI